MKTAYKYLDNYGRRRKNERKKKEASQINGGPVILRGRKEDRKKEGRSGEEIDNTEGKKRRKLEKSRKNGTVDVFFFMYEGQTIEGKPKGRWKRRRGGRGNVMEGREEAVRERYG